MDDAHAGRRVPDVLPWGPDVPVVVPRDDLGDLAEPGTGLAVGLAPGGGRFSDDQRGFLIGVARRGMVVVNGLHEVLPGDNVVNLRAARPDDRGLPAGTHFRATRILTVGTSGGIGKMTTTILLQQALLARGVRADWVATGQTGVIIRGTGRVIDSVVVDFVPGVVERLVAAHDRGYDVLVVEGQGSLFHPAYAPSTIALLHGSRPEGTVLCHRLGQDRHRDYDQALLDVVDAARAHQAVTDALGLACVLVGVSLDSSPVSRVAYERARDRISTELGVACCDPVRESAACLAEAVVGVLPR